MRGKYILKTAVLGLCAICSAFAQYDAYQGHDDVVYIRIDLGPAFVTDNRLVNFGGPVRADVEYKTGFAIAGAIGYHFTRDFAGELEFGAVSADIKSVPGYFSYDSYLSHAPFLVNLVYSRPLQNTRIVPHVGAGLGGAITIFNTEGFGNGVVAVYGDQSDAVFAWQVFGGARVQLSQTVSLGLSYKYFGAGDSSFSYPPLFRTGGPNLTVGFSGLRAHLLAASLQVKF